MALLCSNIAQDEDTAEVCESWRDADTAHLFGF